MKCPTCRKEMFEFDTSWYCWKGCGMNVNKLPYEDTQDHRGPYRRSVGRMLSVRRIN